MAHPALEVADIFRDHGAAWRDANAGHVSLGQLQVMSAIERCRTAALGGHVAACEDCGHAQIAYNSCRNRHCPKCQGAAARDWLAAREADLLPVPYFHLVFTLPAAIAAIAYQNKAVIYDLLFKASSETLLTIAADPKHLGARIGITAVLHTWGSAMTHHPHVHCIVPGGGISLDGSSWARCRPGFFLPVRVLSKLFRRLMLEQLAAAHAAGKLQFFGAHRRLGDAGAFAAFLAPLRTTRWFVYSKRPFAGPQAVLAYLARYTHRVAISNRRLIAADEHGVTFTWKDYRFEGRDRYKSMTLAPNEFIRRFLLHVLPKGFHRIRHYGLLASAARQANLARARQLLAAPAPRTAPDATTEAAATAPAKPRSRQAAARRARAANGARRDDRGRRHGASRPSPAVPVLWRAHDRRRDLRARRRSARPAAIRTCGQDRGRMTPNNASSPRQPAAAPRRRRPPAHTLARSIVRPGPPITPTSTGLRARARTLCHARRDLSAALAAERPRPTRLRPRPRPQPTVKSP